MENFRSYGSLIEIPLDGGQPRDVATNLADPQGVETNGSDIIISIGGETNCTTPQECMDGQPGGVVRVRQ